MMKIVDELVWILIGWATQNDLRPTDQQFADFYWRPQDVMQNIVTAFLCKLEPEEAWIKLQRKVTKEYETYMSERHDIALALTDAKDPIPNQYLENPFRDDNGYRKLCAVADSCLPDVADAVAVVESADKFQHSNINFFVLGEYEPVWDTFKSKHELPAVGEVDDESSDCMKKLMGYKPQAAILQEDPD